ncbi:uncharacterized protein LOC130899843 [Diorhabda carinulata]|uniref:uncharacterized protein LOC130899843 n=1 Tax=Diorhabda carinulata TaxID=1163345 RepID=UPI0025A13E76|nr:uncharacterized protein LOC130899843 [Diorhabda carinulata]
MECEMTHVKPRRSVLFITLHALGLYLWVCVVSIIIIHRKMRFCIVCGNSEDDVKHLFCFPRSADRSQIWQEAMGMKYRPLCGHVRICNEHFTKDRFVPCTSVLRLKADAVPTILEVQKDHVMKGLDQIANKKVNIISQYIIKPEPQVLNFTYYSR